MGDVMHEMQQPGHQERLWRLEADDRHAACTQRPSQKVRQQPSLKPGSDDAGGMLADRRGNGIRIVAHLLRQTTMPC